MKAISIAFHRSWPLVQARLNRLRYVTSPDGQAPPCRKRLDLLYGSIRPSSRASIHKLSAFPKVQQVVLAAASVFPRAHELEFHLRRDFHVQYEVGDVLGKGAFGHVSCVVPVLQYDAQIELAVKTVPQSHIATQSDYAAVTQEGHMMKLLAGTLTVVHLVVTSQRGYRTDRPTRHLRCILHRDVTLDNVLFADTGHDSPVKLMDFGRAAFLEQGDFLTDVHGKRRHCSLQRAVLIKVTRVLPRGLKQDVMVLYSEVSHDGSEIVGLDEFAVFVAAGGYRLTKDEAKGFLRNVDLDGDGLLSRDEFCAALLDWPLVQSQHRQVFTQCADDVFDLVDRDQDGRLAVDDVAKLTSFQEHGKYLHSYRNDRGRCFQYPARSSKDSMDKEDFKQMLRVPADAYVHFPKRLKL